MIYVVGPDDLNLNSDAQDAGPKRVSNFPSYFACKGPVAGLLLSLVPRLETKMPTLISAQHNFHGTFELDPSLAGGHPASFPRQACPKRRSRTTIHPVHAVFMIGRDKRLINLCLRQLSCSFPHRHPL